MSLIWLLLWTLFLALLPTWFYIGLWILVSPHTQMAYAVMAMSGCSALMWQVPRLRDWYWAARYIWNER